MGVYGVVGEVGEGDVGRDGYHWGCLKGLMIGGTRVGWMIYSWRRDV